MKAGNVLESKSLLTERDLAKVLGLRPSTLETWRLLGKGPTFIRLSGRRHVRYPAEEVRTWIRAQVGAAP